MTDKWSNDFLEAWDKVTKDAIKKLNELPDEKIAELVGEVKKNKKKGGLNG